MWEWLGTSQDDSPANTAPELVRLKELEVGRRICRCPLERKDLSKSICTWRRRVRREIEETKIQRAISTGRMPVRRKFGGPPLVHAIVHPDDAGRDITLTDPNGKTQILTNYLHNLFNDPNDNEILPQWVWKRWGLDDLRDIPPLNGLLVKEANLAFVRGKVCGDDRVVAEMLSDLEDNVYDEIAAAFRLRLINHPSDDNEAAWDKESTNKGSQLHGYRFRVWRWERHFYNYTEKENLGDWIKIAQSRRAWMEHFDLWIEWRKRHK